MNPFQTVCPRVLRYGFVVLTQMAAACSVPSETEPPANDVLVPKPEPAFQLADLKGKWENVDPKTDNLTRVEILRPDSTDQFLLRMWGSCGKEECFWGDNAGAEILSGQSNPGSPGLALEWEFESWTSVQQVRLVEKDLLHIETHMQHVDADVVFDVTDRFTRTRDPETETGRWGHLKAID